MSCSELISILQYFIVLSFKSVSQYIEFLIINKVGTTNSWCTISISAYYYHLSVLVSHIVLPRACNKRGGRGRYCVRSSYLKRFDSTKRPHKLIMTKSNFLTALGTIHLRRWQIFMIVDPFPPPPPVFYYYLLANLTIFDPSP